MIVFACFFFVVVSLLVATNEAFLPAPVPVHGVSRYDIAEAKIQLDHLIRRKANDENNRSDGSAIDDRFDDKQTVYVIEFESEPEADSESDTSASSRKDGGVRRKGKDATNEDTIGEPESALDPWSIVWYIGSFGGLVAFFLIVSCSEWCCRRGGGRTLTVPYASGHARRDATGAAAAGMSPEAATAATTTPPPPYHLFAPPPYDSVDYEHIIDKTSGEKLDVYVISVAVHRSPNT